MAVTDAVAEGLTLGAMRPGDAEAASALSEEAGWNQTAADWRFMLERGEGLGLREPGGAWAASSLVLPQGPQVSWISMVLVARRHRRKGYGTMLLRCCIERVQAAGAVPGLDATELGRPVYLPQGFRDLYALSRWRLDAAPPQEALPPGCIIRPMVEDDLGRIAAFDAERTRTEREATLRHLFSQVGEHACLAESRGGLVGYALGRPGRKSAQVGPVVADDPAVAVALLGRMARLGPPVILDVPDAHAAVTAWLQRHGAVRERGFVRMTLGTVPGLDDPRAIFALAGPELS
ncbi:MAG TPA: GNAT family N-acetyltransferase [Microvirga sp.]|jgi:GNAT superfamily N-acetyltransferase|nr:GNAT family N-acetyltransferase [Microvirga sp.]